MPTSPVDEPQIADGDPVYLYKSSLVGAPFEFRLAPDALEWRKGRHAGRTPYDRIKRIRLSFRPATTQNYRFLAEIWVPDGPKLQIASTSYRTIFDQERFDAGYTAFLVELHRRISLAGGTPLLQTGSPPFLFWPGVVIFVGVLLGIAALIVRALQTQVWSAAAFVAAFFALFLWQAGSFFRRNRPGTYRADAVPARVLPVQAPSAEVPPAS
jgi:hypothetical protein